MDETFEALRQLEKRLTSMYNAVTIGILRELVAWLDEIIDEDEWEDLMQYIRWQLATENDNFNRFVKESSDKLLEVGEKSIKRINDKMEKIYDMNHKYMTDVIQRQIGQKFSFRGGAAETIKNIDRFTKRAYNRLHQTQYISKRLEKELKKGIRIGESIPELSNRVQKVCNRSRTSAIAIARTETTRIMNEARLECFDEAEKLGFIVMKRWVATDDSKTRDTHRMLDGETVELDEDFSNGGEAPGDPRLPADQRINCRCVVVPEIIK